MDLKQIGLEIFCWNAVQKRSLSTLKVLSVAHIIRAVRKERTNAYMHEKEID